jgi:hypothetical protein
MTKEKRSPMVRRGLATCQGVALVLLSVLVAFPVPAGAADIPSDYNFGPGPALVRSMGPGQSLRMTNMHLVPGSIPPGFTLVSAITEASIWGNTSDALLDFAILDKRVGFVYGVNDRLGFGVAYDERSYIGGNLDQITLTTHEILGEEQNGRELVDKYDHRIVRYDGDGTTVVFETREVDQFNNAGITVGGHYVLTYGSDGFMPAIGLTGAVRYGTETPDGDEDNPVDYTLGTGFSKRLSETWNLYGAVSYTKYGLTEITTKGSTLTPLEFKEDTVNLMVAGAWQWGEKWATMLQYLRSDGAYEDFGDFSDPSNEVDISFRWQAAEKDVLEFTLIENFLINDNSPDIGFQVAYAHHFGD